MSKCYQCGGNNFHTAFCSMGEREEQHRVNIQQERSISQPDPLTASEIRAEVEKLRDVLRELAAAALDNLAKETTPNRRRLRNVALKAKRIAALDDVRAAVREAVIGSGETK